MAFMPRSVEIGRYKNITIRGRGVARLTSCRGWNFCGVAPWCRALPRAFVSILNMDTLDKQHQSLVEIYIKNAPQMLHWLYTKGE